jgi:riboflavin-specific deaminase-like protein
MKFAGIVDWDREAPQWPALLDAARGGPRGDRKGDHLDGDILWRIYGPLVDAGAARAPFVIGQIGQSLDGRTATQTGHSHYVNGPAAILHLHRLRALVDAVVIGVGTAIADDPQLTVRRVTGPQPAKVVIDPRGRLPASARCMGEGGARRIVIAERAPRIEGVEHIGLSLGAGGFAPRDIIRALRDAGLSRLLVEGGGVTVSRFLEAGALHRLHVMVAPMVIGAGPVGLGFGAVADLKDALRPGVSTYPLPGGDVLFDCAFNTGKELR